MATRNGIGKTISADETGILVALSGARKVSLYNAGTDIAYAMVDATLAELLAAIVAGTAMVLPSGTTYVFQENTSVQTYNNISVACASGETATVYLSAN